MKTVFWIIVAVSTGPYNSGNLTQIDVRFTSEEACRSAMEQIADWRGRATLSCVKIEGGE